MLLVLAFVLFFANRNEVTTQSTSSGCDKGCEILIFFLNLKLEHIDPVVTLDTHDNHPVHVKDIMKAT